MSERDRQTDRMTERQTETMRDRETDTKTHRDTETQRGRIRTGSDASKNRRQNTGPSDGDTGKGKKRLDNFRISI